MATMSAASVAQCLLNARAAIGLAAVLMDLDNLLGQPGIFLGARSGLGLAVGPVVITAAETSKASQSERIGCSVFIALIR